MPFKELKRKLKSLYVRYKWIKIILKLFYNENKKTTWLTESECVAELMTMYQNLTENKKTLTNK